MTRRGLGVRLACLLSLLAWPAEAQTTGARLVREVKPVYPEKLQKIMKQGNVLLIARIDTSGKLQDIRSVATSDELFVGPSVAAVKSWQFHPARRNGKPVEIAANIGIRFRLQNERRGRIPQAILSNLAVFPADASGRKTGEEGFPIRRGGDPRLLADAVLDLSPPDHNHEFTVRVEAISPKGKRHLVAQDRLTAAAKTTEVKIPVTAQIAKDWEDGVWMLRFFVDGAAAGGGQFWLAGDPERFDFAAAMPKR